MTEALLYVALYTVAGTLVPLIPAYLLYTRLPSKTMVKGPFQGLTVQLSGAAAFYFVLVLAWYGFVYRPLDPVRLKYDELQRAFAALETKHRELSERSTVWTVTGQVGFRERAGENAPQNVRLVVRPPSANPDIDGRFRLPILRMQTASGDLEFPILILDHPGYQPTRPGI